MVDPEELRSAGSLPSGPVSAWPFERHMGLMQQSEKKIAAKRAAEQHDKKVKASIQQMAGGLVGNIGRAIQHGRVSAEIREERYDTCKACPHFIEKSKRCSECGCFMEAKTWVGGPPDLLCPKKKWSR